MGWKYVEVKYVQFKGTTPARKKHPVAIFCSLKKKKSLLALLRVDSGGQLPVLLLAHQRPAVLNKTLLSLMGVQNFSSKRTLAAMENKKPCGTIEDA